MKKIIAILAALAVVSMAFAQTVSIYNKVETTPQVLIGGSNPQWGFDGDRILREEIGGTGTTADGRASVWARARLNVKELDTTQTGILNVKPQWHFANELHAAALIKPLNNLEVFVGSHESPLNKGFGPGIEWAQDNFGGIGIADVTGWWEGIQSFRDGIYAGFTGVENLWVGGGIVADSNRWYDGGNLDTAKVWQLSNNGLIKKGAYGPFQFGAKYDTDLFGVGAKYVGQFGGYNAKAAESLVNGESNNATDSKYSHHNIYAGFTFKGLQDAKVGITINAAVDFDTHKNSSVMGTKAYTAFAVSASAGMNFRNDIDDTVAVTVAYQSYDGKKAKVLPFYIGNDLNYQVGDDAKFSLHTSYAQAGLANATKTYTTKDGTAVENGVIGNTNASVITLKPAFSFSMGAHSFGFAVKTEVVNDLKYNQKTANEWAFTSIYGRKARVQFPVSWTYNF